MAKEEKEMTQAKALEKEQKVKETKSEPGSVQRFFQRIGDGIRQYFRETIGELRKVSWPTRRDALSLTGVVLVVMIFMALLLGGLDFLFSFGFGQFFGMF